MAETIKDKLNGMLDQLKIRLSKWNENPNATEKTTTETTEPVAHTFAEHTLEDGSVIQTDTEAVEVGSAVKVANDAGEFIPIPDGDYKVKLPDETICAIKVEAGIITEMVPVEAPPAEEGEPVEQEQSEDTDNYRAEIDSIKAEVEALKEAVKKLSESNTSLEKENSDSRAIIVNLEKQLKEEFKPIVEDTFNVVKTLAEATPEPVAQVAKKRFEKPEVEQIKTTIGDIEAFRKKAWGN
jgi:regulator of replication initiation timing